MSKDIKSTKFTVAAHAAKGRKIAATPETAAKGRKIQAVSFVRIGKDGVKQTSGTRITRLVERVSDAFSGKGNTEFDAPKSAEAKVEIGSADDFFASLHKHAKALDRGEKIKPEVTVTFEDPMDMMRAMSKERLRVMNSLFNDGVSISALAKMLSRDVRAVRRDISALESFGLVNKRIESNEGHGNHTIVEASARKLHLHAVLE